MLISPSVCMLIIHVSIQKIQPEVFLARDQLLIELLCKFGSLNYLSITTAQTNTW